MSSQWSFCSFNPLSYQLFRIESVSLRDLHFLFDILLITIPHITLLHAFFSENKELITSSIHSCNNYFTLECKKVYKLSNRQRNAFFLRTVDVLSLSSEYFIKQQTTNLAVVWFRTEKYYKINFCYSHSIVSTTINLTVQYDKHWLHFWTRFPFTYKTLKRILIKQPNNTSFNRLTTAKRREQKDT